MEPKIPVLCPICEFVTELVADTIFENENIKVIIILYSVYKHVDSTFSFPHRSLL